MRVSILSDLGFQSVGPHRGFSPVQLRVVSKICTKASYQISAHDVHLNNEMVNVSWIAIISGLECWPFIIRREDRCPERYSLFHNRVLKRIRAVKASILMNLQLLNNLIIPQFSLLTSHFSLLTHVLPSNL